jgi:hypothetical protein
MSMEGVTDMQAQHTVPTTATGTRAHRRFRASELRGLRAARVKYGQEVSVIDLSEGGVLFETDGELRRDSTIVLEFLGATRTFLVPSRVVRCSSLESIDNRARSAGACAFRRPLPIDDLVGASRPAASATPSPAPAQPSSDTGWQQVIGKFRDGRFVRGYTNDFSPKKPYLHVSVAPGSEQAQFVSVVQLDALFFMRDTQSTANQNAAEIAPVHGRRVALSLPNGEEMIGATLNYKFNGGGFFVHPLDGRHGTARVFVTQSGVRSVRFL